MNQLIFKHFACVACPFLTLNQSSPLYTTHVLNSQLPGSQICLNQHFNPYRHVDKPVVYFWSLTINVWTQILAFFLNQLPKSIHFYTTCMITGKVINLKYNSTADHLFLVSVRIAAYRLGSTGVSSGWTLSWTSMADRNWSSGIFLWMVAYNIWISWTNTLWTEERNSA